MVIANLVKVLRGIPRHRYKKVPPFVFLLQGDSGCIYIVVEMFVCFFLQAHLHSAIHGISFNIAQTQT